ncbi:MAG: nucleotidyltransferase domain-containing protein [Sulfolobales archaeon]
MREKISQVGEIREVLYDKDHIQLLNELRKQALDILKRLYDYGLSGFVHGSIARGDVHRGSDIDIVILDNYSLHLIINAVEALGGYSHAHIVMATPSHTPKIYFYLDPLEKKVISAPLGKLSTVELEFYRFGGILDLKDLINNQRVAGVDKRLMLIQPTPRGHIERSVIGYEAEVAKILNISIETVLDRVRTLMKRDLYGRTGVYLKIEIPYGVSVEETIERLCREEPIFRKRMLREKICD